MSIRPASLRVASRSAPQPRWISAPVPALRLPDRLDDVTLQERRVRSEVRPAARHDVLGRLAPGRREVALHIRDRGVVKVDTVPIRHDVVHPAAHHDLPGVAEQIVGVAMFVIGGFVVVQAAVAIGVEAVGGDDDVEVESSHGRMVGPPPTRHNAAHDHR